MHYLSDLLLSWGLIGLLLLSTVESAGIPNPGGTDGLLLLLTIARPHDAYFAAAVAVIGSLIGTAIFFEVMRKGGERYLTKYTSSGRGARLRMWFARYGLITVFIPALLPIPFLPFKAFAACAGAMNVGRVRFFVVLIAGRIPRYFALAYLGGHLGKESWPWVKGHVWHMVAIAALLSVGSYLMIRRTERNGLQSS